MTDVNVDGGAIAVEFEIPDLSFSTTLGFRSESAYRLAERFLFGRVSGARLPASRVTRASPPRLPEVWIDIDPADGGRASVAFRGSVESPVYEAELQGFHWDFSKVINSLVMENVIGASLLPVHGACLRAPDGVALLPGASGAGKSSISYAALTQGRAVHASELAFVRHGRFLCGNSALTIDRAAVDLFSLGHLPDPGAVDGTRMMFGLDSGGEQKISRLIFPQVDPGDMRVRPITSRRARMLLFENVVTQLPLLQLLAQETWPLWRPPGRDAVERLMDEVTVLSSLDPVMASGHPRRIAAAVAAGEI